MQNNGWIIFVSSFLSHNVALYNNVSNLPCLHGENTQSDDTSF